MTETDLGTCNQKGCELPAAYLFTWPGRDQAGICESHAYMAQHVAESMGFHLQMIPVEAGRVKLADLAEMADQANRRRPE